MANPVDLTILGLTPGWYGCSQAGPLVVQLRIHAVYDDGIDLEWWVWRRP